MLAPCLRSAPLLLAVLAGPAACIPYTVGSTAHTVTPGETTTQTSWYTIPNGIRRPGDSVGVAIAGADIEWRHGLSARSDAGVRILPGGVSSNYKYRFMDAAPGGMSAAWMVGAGLVNWAEHLHLEATLIASGHELAHAGAVRRPAGDAGRPALHDGRADNPSLGVFAGMQLLMGNFIVRPELGVYHDPSALELRNRNVIFVPAVTFQRTGYGRRPGPRRPPVTLPSRERPEVARPGAPPQLAPQGRGVAPRARRPRRRVVKTARSRARSGKSLMQLTGRDLRMDRQFVPARARARPSCVHRLPEPRSRNVDQLWLWIGFNAFVLADARARPGRVPSARRTWSR